MTEKDLVQEALQQMKNLEDVVQENAKGILGATMAQEISELVKESLSKEAKTKQLNEQPELEDDDTMVDDTAVEVGDVAPDMNDMPVMGDEDDDEGDELGNDFTDDEEDVDVFDAKMLKGDELWSLFKKMDPNNDSFVIDSDGDNIHIKDDENDVEYILKMNEEMEEDMDEAMSMEEEMDESSEEEMDEMVQESKKSTKLMKKETKEGKMTLKPKGVGMGKPGKVYPKSLKHGVTEKESTSKVEAKEGSMTVKPKGMGMGKAKFEYKEGKKMVMKPAKKGGETSEASRTLGAGRKFGRKGLPKPRTAPRHIAVESMKEEINLLREKNDEYKNFPTSRVKKADSTTPK